MVRNSKDRLGFILAAKTTILLLLSVVFFFAPAVPEASAQRRFSRTYPAATNVKLRLMNRSGTVTVEGWNRPEVSISAFLESPAATIAPQSLSGMIYINLVKDNYGRAEVGSVNFQIRVPYDAAVDIETTIGNLIVSSVRGLLVRARVNSEGDITLTNIGAQYVSAESVSGDILYDGDIAESGKFHFKTLQGAINLHIPFNASFRLVATAPSTRSINLGSFGGGNMRLVGDGRRVVGHNGDGSASMTVTNLRGTIAFIRR